MTIYNCHIHTFTIGHVPKNFLPMGIPTLMKINLVRAPVLSILEVLWPFSSKDMLQRYANYIRVTYKKSQRDIFTGIRRYYPSDTRFIVLPMDMAYMESGDVEVSLRQQHIELAKLRDEFPDNIIPFMATDPRRTNLLEMVKELAEVHDFKGIKIYPNLGFHPDDPKLYEVYKYAEEKGLPVMAHCSQGGVHHAKTALEVCAEYGDPDKYRQICKDFPNLKICLAHFGGEDAWKTYLEAPGSREEQRQNWLSRIIRLLRCKDLPNLFTDISYTIFAFNENVPLLKVILQDPIVREKVLFGSDYYMSELEEFEEKKLSIYLRAELGEELFSQIAYENPLRYLGISPSDEDGESGFEVAVGSNPQFISPLEILSEESLIEKEK